VLFSDCIISINSSNLQYLIEGKGQHIYRVRMGCMDEIFKPKMTFSRKKQKSKNVITKNMNESFHNSEKKAEQSCIFYNAPLCVPICSRTMSRDFCPGIFMNRFPLSPDYHILNWIDPDYLSIVKKH
jgi:hypothetical protein